MIAVEWRADDALLERVKGGDVVNLGRALMPGQKRRRPEIDEIVAEQTNTAMATKQRAAATSSRGEMIGAVLRDESRAASAGAVGKSLAGPGAG